MLKEHLSPGDAATACCGVQSAISVQLPVRGDWEVIARDPRGNVKWVETIHNLVTNAGEDYSLDVALSGGSAITTWYVGLIDGTPTAAEADTMASHSGWDEVTAYDEATREAWTDGGVSGQSVSNSGSPAEFTIGTNSTTVGGAFLASDNVKGASDGTLFAVGAFAGGDRELDDDDTVTVTATFTAGGD